MRTPTVTARWTRLSWAIALLLLAASCRGTALFREHPTNKPMPQTPTNPITLDMTGEQAMTAMNAAVEAALGLSSGDTEPTETVPFMLWIDTGLTGGKALRQRTVDDAEWVTIWQMDTYTGGPDLHLVNYLNGADYSFAAVDAGSDLRYRAQFYCTTSGASRTLTLQGAEDRLGRTLRIFRAEYDDPAETLTVSITLGTFQGIGANSFTLEPGESVLLLAYTDALVEEGSAYRLLSHSRGGFTRRFTTTATLNPPDRLVFADATAGAFSITLQPAAECAGQEVRLVKTDASANAVTVDGDGAETINGSTTTALASQYDSVRLVCDGTEWFIL